MTKYKQKCDLCKKNYVAVSTWPRRVGPIICYECEKKKMSGEIKDPEMKKMFDIPEEFYEKNSFLRKIKINYLLYRSLTENQVAAFKRTVEDMSKKKLEANESSDS